MSLDVILGLAGIAAGVTGVASAVGSLVRGKVKLGSITFDFDRTAGSDIRARLDSVGAEAGFRQYALLKEYHAQGLAQSRISFWFSLTFASIGFSVIVLAVALFLQAPLVGGGGMLEGTGKPVFTLVAGTVIDAVAALFFVQSNKARQLMTEFFDKLRTDRKLDESLKMAETISDPPTASRLKALLALHFAEMPVELALFEGVVNPQAASRPTPSVSLVQNS